MGDDDGSGNGSAALLSALVTEHFVLQSARSTLTGEAGSRSSLFLAVLSSSLVAAGFLGSDPGRLAPFLFFAIPVVILLGGLTWARLVELNVEDLRYLSRIQTIRRHYTTLTPEAPDFFPDLRRAASVPGAVPAVAEAFAYMGMRPGPRQLLFTGAATIAAVTSVVTGFAVALLVLWLGGAGALAVPLGAVVGLGTYLAALAAQWRSNRAAFAPA